MHRLQSHWFYSKHRALGRNMTTEVPDRLLDAQNRYDEIVAAGDSEALALSIATSLLSIAESLAEIAIYGISVEHVEEKE